MKDVRIEIEKFINVKGKIIFFGEKKPLLAVSTAKVKDILILMVKKDKRVVILTDRQKYQVQGIVVAGDICGFLKTCQQCEHGKDPSLHYQQIYDRPISSLMTKSVIKVHQDVPLFIGVDIMTQQNIGTLPIIDKDGDLIGFITERHISFLLAETKSNVEVLVRDIMTPNVITCATDDTIGMALNIICDKGFRRLPIIHDGNLVGFLTIKDLARYFTQDNVLQQFKNHDIDAVFNEKITSIMNSPVITIEPDASVTDFAQVLKKHNIGAVPVLENEKLVGIITERDIVKAMTIKHR